MRVQQADSTSGPHSQAHWLECRLYWGRRPEGDLTVEGELNRGQKDGQSSSLRLLSQCFICRLCGEPPVCLPESYLFAKDLMVQAYASAQPLWLGRPLELWAAPAMLLAWCHIFPLGATAGLATDAAQLLC